MSKVLKALLFPVILLTAWPVVAAPRSPVDRLLDEVIQRERDFVTRIRHFTPLLETYIQEIPEGGAESVADVRDHYFLGRLDLDKDVEYTPLVTHSEPHKRSGMLFFKKRSVAFVPTGFAQMIFIDSGGFNRTNYEFEYIRREFLGEVRCFVFDVVPTNKERTGQFIGRIWVEDHNYNVVRFNGTYTGSSPDKLYFHFDSWRMNITPGEWVPAFIYTEESNPLDDSLPVPRFKAQSRLWSYRPARENRLEELTNILIETDSGIRDQSQARDVSPLKSQRLWEHQAEENVVERLETGGLLAPYGEVNEVIDTVVNNLVVTNDLAVNPHCRVLLTTPLETFSFGNTIVISRGLIDVLPDEASLAMVLAGELAHIALGHRTNTQFAFNDETMLTDQELLENFRFSRSEAEIAEANRKAAEILQNSPYKEKLGNAGLFLRALGERAPQFPSLISANFGNQLASGGNVERLSELAISAPKLEDDRLDQIAALPLGSRVRLDPWTNRIEMIKAEPVALTTARDKLPFEITPYLMRLERKKSPGQNDMLVAEHGADTEAKEGSQ